MSSRKGVVGGKRLITMSGQDTQSQLKGESRNRRTRIATARYHKPGLFNNRNALSQTTAVRKSLIHALGRWCAGNLGGSWAYRT